MTTQIIPPPTQATIDEIHWRLRGGYPFGSLVAENWHNQPWVSLILEPHPHPMTSFARELLDWYAPLRVPLVTSDGDTYPVELRIVPRFVLEELLWNREENEDVVYIAESDEPYCAPTWPEYPTNEQIAAALGRCWGAEGPYDMAPENPQVTAALLTILTTLGPSALKDFAIHDVTLGEDWDRIVERLTSFAAAAEAATA